MDYKEPKTRKELKGNKSKDVYNQKSVRLKEALIEKTLSLLNECRNEQE